MEVFYNRNGRYGDVGGVSLDAFEQASPWGTEVFRNQGKSNADALTKVVMALEDQSASLLRHYDASAYTSKADEGWRATSPL